MSEDQFDPGWGLPKGNLIVWIAALVIVFGPALLVLWWSQP